MRNKWIRLLVLLAAAVALAFGMEALQIATQPKQYTGEEVVVREAGELDFAVCALENAELKNGAVAIGEGGGTILCDFGQETDVPYLQLWSKKILHADVQISVSWAAAGEELPAPDTEERTVSFSAVSGEKGWTAPIPAGKYQKLRITTDGKMTLSSVLYSEEETQRVPVEEGMRLWRVAILIPILFACLAFLSGVRVFRRLKGVFLRAWGGLTASGRRTALHTVLFIVVMALGYFAAQVIFLGGTGKALLWPQQLFCLGFALVAACLATFWNTLANKPENLFLILCLTAGSLMVFLFPSSTLIGLDDDYHFDQALIYSYLGEERLTAQDFNFTIQEADKETAFRLNGPREAWLEKLDEQSSQGAIEIQNRDVELKNAYELISGFGLYLGRVLGLRYWISFALGKFFSLLTYALCGYYAIRRLKSGKLLAAVCLLIPSAMCMASQYTYDTALNGFIPLGLAYCFAEWQEPEKKMTRGNAAVMLLSLAFGSLPKAIYCPVLFIPFFLPKSKFVTRESHDRRGLTHRGFLLLTVLTVILLLATFVLPMLTGGTEGDSRGGEDVDAYGQITYILSHPMEYTQTLLTQLRDYCNAFNAVSVINLFAYMGTGPYTEWLMVLLLFAAFTDRGRQDAAFTRSVWRRALGLFWLFGIVCLICTSMYIIYCPVGQGWIGGCQPRYLIPVIYPTLVQAGPVLLIWMAWRSLTAPVWLVLAGAVLLAVCFCWRVFPDAKIKGKPIFPKGKRRPATWTKALYNGLILAAAGYILFAGVFETCISRFIG